MIYALAYVAGMATVFVPAAIFCGFVCAWGE